VSTSAWLDAMRNWLLSMATGHEHEDDIIEGVDSEGNHVTFVGVKVTGMTDPQADSPATNSFTITSKDVIS
jgi:hypothetical protein